MGLEVTGYDATAESRIRSARPRRLAAALTCCRREQNAARAQTWDAARERRLPSNLAEILVEGRSEVDDPTRKHGAVALERLVEAAPYTVGGSADLAGSAAPCLNILIIKFLCESITAFNIFNFF